MPSIKLKTGTSLCYTTAGSPSPTSPTVLYIHGLGSSQNYYYAQLEALSSSYYCILFDTPGSGQSRFSADAKVRPTLTSIVDEVVELLCYLNVSSAVVVGHSLGGLLATWLSLVYPDRVDGLVLLGPIHPSPALATIFQARIKSIQESGYSLEQIYNVVPMSATGSRSTPLHHAFIRELISRQDPQGYIATCHVIATAPTPDFSVVVKSARKIPALVLAGGDDTTAPFEGCVDKVAKGLHAEVQVLDGIGHWHAIEAPDVVTDAIRNLCQKLENRL
ncbi:Alpha/Beta hydrolase protein [Lipomyces starkeyi]